MQISMELQRNQVLRFDTMVTTFPTIKMTYTFVSIDLHHQYYYDVAQKDDWFGMKTYF